MNNLSKRGGSMLYGIQIDGLFALLQTVFVLLKLSGLVDWDYAFVFIPSVLNLLSDIIRYGESWLIFADFDNGDDADETENR